MSAPGISLLSDLSLETNERERRARSIAAFVLLFRAGPQPGLFVGIHGDDAVADRHLARYGEVHQSPRGLMGDDLEVDGVAANDTAERDHAVIRTPAPLRGVKRNRNRARDFER